MRAFLRRRMTVNMFEKQYGDVRIFVMRDVPKRGKVLCAVKEGESREIYMDFFGLSIPDGTNAYMFGNKLIIVTRWADMTEEEIASVTAGELRLVFAPYRFLQGAVKIGDYDWSDITFTLYHCMQFLNNDQAPVEEIIFLFCDKASGQIVADRDVAVPPVLGEYLRGAMVRAHEAAFLDFKYEQYLDLSETSDELDFCDVMYNALDGLSEGDRRLFRSQSPDAIPGGVYAVIDWSNEITDLKKHKGT